MSKTNHQDTTITEDAVGLEARRTRFQDDGTEALKINDGQVEDPQVVALRTEVGNLEEKITEGAKVAAEKATAVTAKSAEVEELRRRIRSGDVAASALHSHAEAKLMGLQREHADVEQALTALRGRHRAKAQELEVREALAGTGAVIPEAQREVEITEAVEQVRAILEPLARRYRASDRAMHAIADTLQRYENQGVRFSGITTTGGPYRVDTVRSGDVVLDARGAFAVGQIGQLAHEAIDAAIAEEIRDQRS